MKKTKIKLIKIRDNYKITKYYNKNEFHSKIIRRFL